MDKNNISIIAAPKGVPLLVHYSGVRGAFNIDRVATLYLLLLYRTLSSLITNHLEY